MLFLLHALLPQCFLSVAMSEALFQIFAISPKASIILSTAAEVSTTFLPQSNSRLKEPTKIDDHSFGRLLIAVENIGEYIHHEVIGNELSL